MELKNHDIPKLIAPNIFNNNKIEFEILLNWIKEKKLTTKQIFDYMLRNFVDKNNFNYKADSSVIANYIGGNAFISIIKNIEKKVICLNSSSSVCKNCFPLVWF